MLWILEQLNICDYDTIMRLLPHISSERRAKVLRMRDKSSQIQSIAVELLLLHGLRAEYGRRELPPVLREENGKPYFPGDAQICFNLSHCDTAVACALDHSPVGIDVQQTGCLHVVRGGSGQTIEGLNTATEVMSNPSSHEEIHSLLWVLHREEREWVLKGATPEEREQRFIRVWTFKEAYGKANGAGILYELEKFNALPCLEGAPWRGFSFQSLLRGDTFVTLCSKSPLDVRTVPLGALISNNLIDDYKGEKR